MYSSIAQANDAIIERIKSRPPTLGRCPSCERGGG
ncbi:Uncharacterised protein [Citrobacter amalonaticus]|nr:Uncharacterised protein [Citrobacter amalonaticus]